MCLAVGHSQQWRIYKGAPPARAPPLLKIKFQILKAEIVTRAPTPPPHPRKEKISKLAPPLIDFLGSATVQFVYIHKIGDFLSVLSMVSLKLPSSFK